VIDRTEANGGRGVRVSSGGCKSQIGVDDKHIRASEPSGTEDGDIMVEFLRLSLTTSALFLCSVGISCCALAPVLLRRSEGEGYTHAVTTSLKNHHELPNLD
jgi:hypothetical protein